MEPNEYEEEDQSGCEAEGYEKEDEEAFAEELINGAKTGALPLYELEGILSSINSPELNRVVSRELGDFEGDSDEYDDDEDEC